MAASHWVLLSPSTYNLAWSSYFMGGDLWEVAKVTPSLFAFRQIHLLIACIAHNWHLPSIFIISYRQVNRQLFKGHVVGSQPM